MLVFAGLGELERLEPVHVATYFEQLAGAIEGPDFRSMIRSGKPGKCPSGRWHAAMPSA